MDKIATEKRLREILTSQLLISVYNLKWPYLKKQKLSGAQVGQFHFRPNVKYLQDFYNLVFHAALVPLSELPLNSILEVDFNTLLPDPSAADYTEQSLGLITILDQPRMILSGYGLRYSRAFFDPIAEKLFRQLIAQPKEKRPDSKTAWISRGYSIEDWLVRVLWFWGPPLHSDTFMTEDRQVIKDWLHHVRIEVEQISGVKDPLAKYEEVDDHDYKSFTKLFFEGPPQKSYNDTDNQDATISDYAFWWIRVSNAHFPITDFAGHYPFWVRHVGNELSDRDRTYLDETNGYLLESGNDALFDEIRDDVLKGIWKPLPPNDAYEQNSGSKTPLKIPGERGHGPVVHPRRSNFHS